MCLVPEDGNSSNQLAVIETYEGNEFAAAEMYFRSLQVAQPFPSALGNLLLLFKKAERQINKTQMAFDFKTSFLGLLGCLLGEKRYFLII